VAAGDVIFEEGQPGQEMYGVISGAVELRRSDGTVFRVGPDGTFGEMALIDGSPRSTSAVAAEDTVLAVIDQKKFIFLVQETPMFALQVMSSLAERLRSY
jgi:CRP-like cAMP-binding protein